MDAFDEQPGILAQRFHIKAENLAERFIDIERPQWRGLDNPKAGERGVGKLAETFVTLAQLRRRQIARRRVERNTDDAGDFAVFVEYRQLDGFKPAQLAVNARHALNPVFLT